MYNWFVSKSWTRLCKGECNDMLGTETMVDRVLLWSSVPSNVYGSKTHYLSKYLLHKLEQQAASETQTSSAPHDGLHCHIISNQQFQAN